MPAAGLLAPATASAGQAVVAATVYTGSQQGITSTTVTSDTLGSCPPYSGASPFLLNPGGTSYQPAAGSAWSLGTVAECGLNLPAASITGVSVLRSAERGFEAPLSVADLTDPSSYNDLTAPGALPVISLDGGQNQVTYARPERSPSDSNATDEVVDSGPVTIAVYENAPPLQVRASAHRLPGKATALREQFTATVTDAAGQTPSPTALSWSWSFGDETGSGQAAPRHAFPLGRWFVTVVVTDRASGTGGTDTIPVSVDSRALSAAADRGGAGHRHTGASSGAVKDAGVPRGHGRPAVHAGPHQTSSPAPAQRSGGGQAATTGATPTPAVPAAPVTPAPAATPTSSPAPAAHSAALHKPSHRRRLRRVTRARSGAGGRIVRGLLIADVTPVAPAASRLTQTPAAVSVPALVHAATRSPAGFSGLLGAALIVVLLALGAGREHRGRRRWRELRPGP